LPIEPANRQQPSAGFDTTMSAPGRIGRPRGTPRTLFSLRRDRDKEADRAVPEADDVVAAAEVSCLACGQVLPPEAAFCGECGTKVATPAPAAAAAPSAEAEPADDQPATTPAAVDPPVEDESDEVEELAAVDPPVEDESDEVEELAAVDPPVEDESDEVEELAAVDPPVEDESDDEPETSGLLLLAPERFATSVDALVELDGEPDPGGKRSKRRPVLWLAGAAAVLALVMASVLVAAGDKNADDAELVAAETPASGDVDERRPRQRSATGSTATTVTEDGETVDPDTPDAQDSDEGGDDEAPAPSWGDPGTTIGTPSGGTQPGTATAPASPSGAPPPPPPPPPTTKPPPPASLSASSACHPGCTIPRGGSFQIAVRNTGGQPGQFLVRIAGEFRATPSSGTVGPGQIVVINVVHTSDKRSDGTVEVIAQSAVIFSTAVKARR
jgi:hypothetical protein